MSELLSIVDQKTQLAGKNRIDLLLFTLTNGHTYGINVFKVQEVITYPGTNEIKHDNSAVIGVSDIRGSLITLLDLSVAIGLEPASDREKSFVIVTEYNNRVQGFIVSAVDRIVNMHWEEISSPPEDMSSNSQIVAYARISEELVDILDVEKILQDVLPVKNEISEQTKTRIKNEISENTDSQYEALIVDDSMVARKQITAVLSSIGIKSIIAKNGVEGLSLLESYAEQYLDVQEKILFIITDVEMPEMDGYTLTKHVKSHPKLQHLPVILHTSLSGGFNKELVKSVKADKFVSKFHPEILAEEILKVIQSVRG